MDGMARSRPVRELAAAALALVVLLSAGLLAAGPTGEGKSSRGAIVKGPYLQNLTTGNVTICWATDAPTDATVRYGRDGAFDLSSSDPALAGIHELTLFGLLPNTTYDYYVVSNSTSSAVSRFRTAPAGPVPFRFGVYGDTRTNHQNHTNVLSMMHSYAPEFYLNCGDLVDSGINSSDWDTFFGIISPRSNDTAYWPSIGNHDTPTANYKKYFSLPGNEEYYSFDWGNVHVVALDTTGNYVNGSAQNDWLRADLAASGAEWKFVFFHHPPYSSMGHGSTLTVRNILNPVFEQHRVDAVFAGHDHDYEHARPGNGIEYFVTGGGGAPLSPSGSSWYTVYSESVYHFMTVDIDGNVSTLRAIRENGTLMEQVRIVHPDRIPPAPVAVRAEDAGTGGVVLLNWSGYDEAAQGDVAAYRVFASRNGLTTIDGLVPNLTVPAGTLSAAVGDLENNTRYHFAVAAVDTGGNIDARVTAASAVPTDITPPAPPGNLRVTERQFSYIGLAWDRGREPDLAGYRVHVNETGSGAGGPFRLLSGPLLSTIYRAEGLEMNTTYHFAVDAFDRASPGPNNSTLSAAVSATTKLQIPNRAPEAASPLPELTVEEDSKTPALLAFSSVFSDPDGDPLYFSYQPSAGLRLTELPNGSGLEIIPVPDWNGPARLSLSANDSILEASARVNVTVTPKNDPPVIEGLEPLWSFTEDIAGSFEFWAEDRADNDTSLHVATDLPTLVSGLEPGKNYWLNTSAEGPGRLLCTVTVIAANANVGTYACHLNVTDSAGGTASAALSVNVVNVNDPPVVRILSPADGQAFLHNTSIDLVAESSDEDAAYGDILSFEWRADGSVLGRTQNLSGIVLRPGNHTITVTVKDSSGAGARASVSLTVKEPPAPPPPPPPPPEPPGERDGGPSLLPVAAAVAALVLACALAVYLLHRRSGTKERAP